jgi:general secretion pathway protein H
MRSDFGVKMKHGAQVTLAPPSRKAGFTLIEIMVVIVIIGILINFAVLSMRSNTPIDQLNEESRRLKSLIEIASEEALLRSSFIGIDISETGYAFLRYEDKTWQPLTDNLFRGRELPEEVSLSVTTAQPMDNDDDDDQKLAPEIILFSSGEITQFDLKISSIHSDDYYRLSGDETGELTLDLISPY